MRSIRLNSMEQYILQHGTISVEQLAQYFKISINTVRRDLEELELRGHVTKVYGGVSAVNHSSVVPIPVRSQLNYEGKAKIGKLAATLVDDASTIFIDSGSTTVHMIKYLANRQSLSLLTHSLPALNEASAYPSINLISFGGIYNVSTGSFVGISTVDVINTLTITKAFMAATGISIKNGIANNTYFEAEIKRRIVNNSQQIILMADHSKFNHDALISFCGLKDLTAVITDREPPADYVEFFSKHKIKLLY